MLKLKTVIILISAFATALSVFISCKNYRRNDSHPEISNSNISEGEKLAKKY